MGKEWTWGRIEKLQECWGEKNNKNYKKAGKKKIKITRINNIILWITQKLDDKSEYSKELKGVFANNERGYRLTGKNKRFDRY